MGLKAKFKIDESEDVKVVSIPEDSCVLEAVDLASVAFGERYARIWLEGEQLPVYDDFQKFYKCSAVYELKQAEMTIAIESRWVGLDFRATKHDTVFLARWITARALREDGKCSDWLDTVVLLFRGRPLSDLQTFGELGIEDGDELRLLTVMELISLSPGCRRVLRGTPFALSDDDADENAGDDEAEAEAEAKVEEDGDDDELEVPAVRRPRSLMEELFRAARRGLPKGVV
jgi:hypothetical protein